MTDERPRPHSPLNALIVKVLLWIGLPLLVIGLFVYMAALGEDVGRREQRRSLQKLIDPEQTRQRNEKSLKF